MYLEVSGKYQKKCKSCKDFRGKEFWNVFNFWGSVSKIRKNNVMNLFGRMIILFWMFWGRSIGAHRVYFFFCLFFLYRMFSSVAHCHISRTVRLSPCDILYWMFDIESCLKIYFVQICFVYMFRWMLLGFFSIVVFWSFLRFCWPLYCFSCSVTCMF